MTTELERDTARAIDLHHRALELFTDQAEEAVIEGKSGALESALSFKKLADELNDYIQTLYHWAGKER